MNNPLHIILQCSETIRPKAQYVFDSLFMARGIPVKYSAHPPPTGAWLLYAPTKEATLAQGRCLAIAHCPASWRLFGSAADFGTSVNVDGLITVFPERAAGFAPPSDISFDIVANAFYFLSSWSERCGPKGCQTRLMYSNSIFVRLGVPQDIVDQYLALLIDQLNALCGRLGQEKWGLPEWPQGASHALVLSHDVDFIPTNFTDIAVQGAKTVLRHLVRQRDPAGALKAAAGLALALMQKRDPYGCVPEIIRREIELGVSSSFQVAVGHRHPCDVNYKIEDDRICGYLRAISDAGFDLCLHGSYRSTENTLWYGEEAALLTHRLGKPLGSRQHFLSFDYDNLFMAQEQAGIQYDMSMGFPDRTGPRAGFSYPYFPYSLKENRPYNVLQLNLFLMDVTLQSYMGLKGAKAWEAIKATLDDLRQKQGCVSTVWHPIVFGGARDPGYDLLYWDMVNYVKRSGGLATDGRAINSFWRGRANGYPSFNPKLDFKLKIQQSEK